MANTQKTTGFVAGTLVNTDKGLIAIEQLKVGDKVLSAPENAKPSRNEMVATAYKKVTKTFKSQQKQPLMAALGYPSIICTPNHPFWTFEKGWISAEELAREDRYYYIFDSDSGSYGGYSMYTDFDNKRVNFKTNKFLYETPYEHLVVGFEGNNGYGERYVWDYYPYVLDITKDGYVGTNGPGNFDEDITEAEKELYMHAIRSIIDVYDQGDEFYKDYVYNIDVEDYHTYFVGHDSIWVHDAHQ